MDTILSDTLRVGDVILPPARELNLWMRRHVEEHKLPETALYLTVTAIREGTPDKRGRWLIVQSDQTDEWYSGELYERRLPFTFKVRPVTAWPLISRKAGAP